MTEYRFCYNTTELLDSGDVNEPKKAGKQLKLPSWCWAASRGGATFLSQSQWRSGLKVEAWNVESQGMDTSGQVLGGRLTLRSLFGTLTCLTWDLYSIRTPISAITLWGAIHKRAGLNTVKEPRVMLDILQEDFKEENSKGLLFSMCARSKTGDGTGMYILLFKMVEGERGTFRRIGLAYAWSERVKERILKSSERELKLPCLEYRDGLHSIYII
jgi:hypothetical protein